MADIHAPLTEKRVLFPLSPIITMKNHFFGAINYLAGYIRMFLVWAAIGGKFSVAGK